MSASADLSDPNTAVLGNISLRGWNWYEKRAGCFLKPVREAASWAQETASRTSAPNLVWLRLATVTPVEDQGIAADFGDTAILTPDQVFRRRISAANLTGVRVILSNYRLSAKIAANGPIWIKQEHRSIAANQRCSNERVNDGSRL